MKTQNQTNRLSAAQMMVVRRGIKSGLTKEQVAVYARPDFTTAQMEEILQGYLDGLKMSEVKVYADPLVSLDEMRRIRRIYQLTAEIDRDQNRLTKTIQDAERRSSFPVQKNPFRRNPTR